MSSVIKTAIALPKADYQLIETIRKKTGKSRSQILVEAFHAWLKDRENKKLEKQDIEGYRKYPEDASHYEWVVSDKALWDKESW